MSKTDFVHLHLHSQYSLLDGANRLDDVIGTAVSMGMPAVALTDHGNMFGAIEFYTRCKAAGIKPLVGVEAYVAQGSRLDRTPGRGSSNHLVLLAKNETGYRNLLKLTSSAYLEGFYYKPRIDKGLLRQHSEGLIGLSACLKGEINEKIVGNLEKEARPRRATSWRSSATATSIWRCRTMGSPSSGWRTRSSAGSRAAPASRSSSPTIATTTRRTTPSPTTSCSASARRRW
ncbi:MAG: PHP domain-containing protein, partial [Thermoanaerobaculia bacterium]